MSFPPHIARIFEVFGVPADTKAALYDLYVSMGDVALEVFSEIAEDVDPATLTPERSPWARCSRSSSATTSPCLTGSWCRVATRTTAGGRKRSRST